MPLSTRYESMSTGDAAVALLMRLVAPDGLATSGILWGGAADGTDLPSGTQYPAFLGGVQDEQGRVWPVGEQVATDIEFVDADGASTLYLLPFGATDEFPTGTRLGNFSIVSQLTVSDAPPDSLELGTGTVVSSAFTAYTEASGVRRVPCARWA